MGSDLHRDLFSSPAFFQYFLNRDSVLELIRSLKEIHLDAKLRKKGLNKHRMG